MDKRTNDGGTDDGVTDGDSIPNDFDSPWKEILEAYFQECIAFFFPDVHHDIDWSKGYEFLDKELQQIVREAEVGKRMADKLVKVWLATGEQVWVLIHIEVQSQSQTDFAKRMFIYNYRLRDIFDRPVASFAILSDGKASWRPQRFDSGLWGCNTSFEFRTVKLLDYQQDSENLLNSDNPFAVVVVAHLKTIETTRDPLSRKRWKLSLVKLLYQRGHDRADVIELLRFIDWLLTLPTALEADFWRELRTYQEEMNMPYVTSLERLAREEGREEGLIKGLRSGIRLALKLGFGEAGLKLASEVEGITDIVTLRRIEAGLEEGRSLEELRKLCA